MHQSYYFTGHQIARMDFMVFLALASATLLWVGWRGGFSSLTFPDMTGMVGFFPGGGFGRCYSFIYFLRNIHAFKHYSCLLVGLTLKFPAL